MYEIFYMLKKSLKLSDSLQLDWLLPPLVPRSYPGESVPSSSPWGSSSLPSMLDSLFPTEVVFPKTRVPVKLD